MFEDLKLVAGVRITKQFPAMLQPIFQKGDIFYAQAKDKKEFVFMDVTQGIHELKAMHEEFLVEINGKTLAEYNIDPKKEILAYAKNEKQIIIDNIEPFVEKMSKIHLSKTHKEMLAATKARIASGVER